MMRLWISDQGRDSMVFGAFITGVLTGRNSQWPTNIKAV